MRHAQITRFGAGVLLVLALAGSGQVLASGYWKLDRSEIRGDCQSRLPAWIKILDQSGTHWRIHEYDARDARNSMTYRISWSGPPSTLAPEQLVPLSIKVEIQEANGHAGFRLFGRGASAFGGSTTARTPDNIKAGMVAQATNKQDGAPSDKGVVRHGGERYDFGVSATLGASACGIERHYSYVYVLGNSQPTAATLLNTVNSAGVTHGHATAPSLRITRAYKITKITTYHYGAMSSQGMIALRGSDGRIYGPWRVQPVQGGWFAVYPNVIVPAGTYAVVDSDPKSWSHNAGSNNVGMTMIEGIAQ